MGAGGALTRDVATARGPARAHLHLPADPAGALVLGHGAGGSVSAPDLAAATSAAVGAGLAVALVEQPYRVAGRRSPPPAQHLDAAWLEVLGDLVSGPLRGLDLYTGGRSSGARVACRTAAAAGAAGVVCLAFPARPPARRSGAAAPSRLHELDDVRVPVLVVQGERDAFGVPPEAPGRTVVRVRGDHRLAADPGGVADAVAGWLERRLGRSPPAGRPARSG